MGERIWLGRAVSPMVATSPGQRPGNAIALNKTFGIFEPYGSKMPRALGA